MIIKKQNEELAVELEDFPVFKQLRKQKFYNELKEKYPETFAIKSTQIDEENDDEGKVIVKKDNGKFKITIKIKEKNIEKREINKRKKEE